jgi:hypothetical protein
MTAGWMLLCAAVIAAFHVTYVNNGFVWLDHGDIEQGRALIPLSQWRLAFTNSYQGTGFYRPLVTLFHSIDASLWGISAPGFHCTNIALHCVAALAAPFLVSAFFPLSLCERCLVTVIFGLHPVAILSVGCISYRSEPLLALFTFLAVSWYAKVRKRGTFTRTVILFLTTACACFSKETAFFYLPSFFILWEISRLPGNKPHPCTKPTGSAGFIPAVFAAIAATGTVLCLRCIFVPVKWCITPAHIPFPENISTRIVLLGKHILNLASPFMPRICDATGQYGILHPATLLVLCFIVAIVFTAVKKGTGSPLTLTFSMIAICLLPSLDLLPLPRFYSPHYVYIAVAPLGAFVVLLGRKMSGYGRKFYAVFRGIVFVWIAVMGFTTVSSGSSFRSDQTLFAPEVSKDARFSEGWFYLGNFYRLSGDLDAADSAYDRGLAVYPGIIRFYDPVEFLINKSAVAVQRKNFDAADSLMKIAQTLSSEAMQPDILYIRADIAARRGDFKAVIYLLSGRSLLRPEARRLLDRALSAGQDH